MPRLNAIPIKIVRQLLFINSYEKYMSLQFSVVTFKTSINEMFFIFDI